MLSDAGASSVTRPAKLGGGWGWGALDLSAKPAKISGSKRNGRRRLNEAFDQWGPPSDWACSTYQKGSRGEPR